MPRSPRYSRAQLSKPKIWLSRSRGPSAWQACRYSCAMVPSGIRPSFMAYSTLLVPANCGSRAPGGACTAGEVTAPSRAVSVRSTSSCQSLEKRRRVP
jgi:hypothetical protein